jgi:citrate lyase subunit beta/citryl-CoA lyase
VQQPQTDVLASAVRASRGALLATRRARQFELPLRFWRQQVHFTTPASGQPEKALSALAGVPRLLARFELTVDAVAGHLEVDPAPLQAVLDGDRSLPAVLLDAEDAVAATAEAARQARAGAVACFRNADFGRALRLFRPAGIDLDGCVDDLVEVLSAVAGRPAPDDYPIDAVVWPKAESGQEIAWLCEVLGMIERQLGLPEGHIRVQFLVESARAVERLTQLTDAAGARLAGIVWGIADYSADVGLPHIRNDHPVCDWARCALVNAAGACGVPAIDSMTLNYPTPLHRGETLSAHQREQNRARVLAALHQVYTDARHGMELGMAGKWVGHPLQAWLVLAAYREALPAAQLARDLAQVEAYQRAVLAGSGATIVGEGMQAYMADRASDRHLRSRLRRAAAWGLLPAAEAARLGVISEAECAQLDSGAA